VVVLRVVRTGEGLRDGIERLDAVRGALGDIEFVRPRRRSDLAQALERPRWHRPRRSPMQLAHRRTEGGAAAAQPRDFPDLTRRSR